MSTTPKLALFFNSSEGYGWTENYYWKGTLSVPPLTAAMNQLLSLRAGFLTMDCRLIRMRVQSGHKRDPYIFDFSSNNNGIGQYEGSQNNSDNAVLVRLEAVDVGYNRVFMRGIPDSLLNQNKFTPDSAWTSAFNAWKAYFLGTTNMAVQANVDTPGVPQRVVSLLKNSPKGIILTLATGQTLGAAKQVRITNATIFGYNGVKNVILGPTAPDTTRYVLGGAMPQTDNPLTDNPLATPINPSVGQVTSMFLEGFTTRRPGRFFGQRPGRRRTTLSLRP